MEKKVRMADIAEELNISVVSVSKALSDKEGVSDAMRERIKTVARQMGYTPLRTKPAARGAASTGNVGILVADCFFVENSFYASLYRQLSLRCNEHGYAALLEIVTEEAEEKRSLPAMIQGNKVDRLIFLGQINADYIRAVTQNGIPYVFVDFYDEQINAMSITSDNLMGGYRITSHLLSLGHKKIGFFGSIQETSSIMDRFLGYSKALLKAGLQVRMDWVLEDRDAHGRFQPMRFPEEMPTAFLCSCDEVAYNLVQQLNAAGFRVPEDVAVTGYDDYRIALLCKPQLTSYRVNLVEMSHAAVKQLVAIGSQTAVGGNIVINGDLVHRGST